MRVSCYLGPISKQACYEKHCLLFEWFTIQTPGTMVVQFSDQHLCNGPGFGPPFEYRSAIPWYHGSGHLNSGPFE